MADMLESTLIIVRARALIAEFGEGARDAAEAEMSKEMLQGDMATAGLWMAIAHEIHQIQQRSSGTAN
jgi:hypothetical protein